MILYAVDASAPADLKVQLLLDTMVRRVRRAGLVSRERIAIGIAFPYHAVPPVPIISETTSRVRLV